MPDLKRRRKDQQALAAVSAAARIDDAFASVILGDATVLQAEGDRNEPALYDLAAAETPGLTATFFVREDPFNFVEAVPSLDYSATGATKLPPNPFPGEPITGHWMGYILAPESGRYDFVIETDVGATVTLSLDGRPIEPDEASLPGQPWKKQGVRSTSRVS